VARSIGELPPGLPGALPPVESTKSGAGSRFPDTDRDQFPALRPVATPDALRALVDGVQVMTGVAAVKSDGIHMLVQYDTARIQLPQLRQRLTELGHPPAPAPTFRRRQRG